MKKILMMAIVVAAGIAAQAGNYDWFEAYGATDSTDWNAPGNWFDSDVGSFAVTAPEAADWVRIDGKDWATQAIHSHFPIINSNVGTISKLSLGGSSASGEGALAVNAGGNLAVAGDFIFGEGYTAGGSGLMDMSGGFVAVSGLMSIGSAAGTSGTLNLSGGLVQATSLYVGHEGAGVVNLSGDAILHAGDYISGQQFGVGGTGLVNIEGSSQLIVNGDHITSGHAGNVIALGWVDAATEGEWIEATYDSENARTVYTAVPEPATIGLFGLVGAGLIFVRRFYARF